MYIHITHIETGRNADSKGPPMTAYALTELTAATMVEGGAPYGLIEDALIAVADGRIAWFGSRADAPREVRALPTQKQGGRLATPGLIDCHTHIVHGGDRAREFEMRLEGAGYEEIARAGGGILSTVTATRAAGEDALVEAALPRLDTLIAEGVTTIEIKSGYGLDIDTELTMLRAARRLAAKRDIEVVTSFLGAHAIPPEYKDRADAYIDEVCLQSPGPHVVVQAGDCRVRITWSEERAMDQIDPQYANDFLLIDAGIVKHIDVQDNRVWLTANLRLKTQPHPSLTFIGACEIACRDGVTEGEKTCVVAALLFQSINEQSVFFVQH